LPILNSRKKDKLYYQIWLDGEEKILLKLEVKVQIRNLLSKRLDFFFQ
jgi:hypothetical protein